MIQLALPGCLAVHEDLSAVWDYGLNVGWIGVGYLEIIYDIKTKEKQIVYIAQVIIGDA